MDYREKVLYLLSKHNQDSNELKASISELQKQLNDYNQQISIMSKALNVPEFVDLDLPSGTKWMTKNLGAKRMWDYGYYFQWGSTVGYSDKDIKTHALWKYCPGNNEKEQADTEALKKWNEKYLSKSSGKLTKSVDAAFNLTNGAARLPSIEQIKELLKSTNAYIENNFQGSGINGMIFASKKTDSKYIFIPASGSASDGGIWDRGNYGVIWVAAPNPEDITKALAFTYNISAKNMYGSTHSRYEGLCIRAVLA
nr:MAG TPA: hypothetical protein [Crassvirales sp.]